MDNFESLSMILIDKKFDGKEFAMSEFYFAEDLLVQGKKIDEEEEDEIQDKLKLQSSLHINLQNCGEKICVKYIDIYGNEFTEELKTNI
jgi:site-specific DNA-methyltransferase (adenine-specific)/adenine-specific DNA-methyltransferase